MSVNVYHDEVNCYSAGLHCGWLKLQAFRWSLLVRWQEGQCSKALLSGPSLTFSNSAVSIVGRTNKPKYSVLQCESTKNPPEIFWHFFPNGWEFLVQILHGYYTLLPIHAGLQIFQLPATLTKLRHIKRNHRYVLKMSTIDRNARWVVALNVA